MKYSDRHSILARFVAVTIALTSLLLGASGLASASTHLSLPSRLLDTRDDTGGHHSRLAVGEVLQLVVAGRAGVVPGATAAALNVTAVGPGGDGFLTVWPCGGTQPTTSNLNFRAGVTIANAVLVGLGSGGKVCLSASVPTDVLADVSAWFDGSSPIVPLAPQRIVDTRSALGRSTARPLAVGEVLRVPIKERVGVVNDAASAIVNLTAVDASANGFLTAYPCDQSVPTTSNVNVASGGTVANAVVVSLSSDGALCVVSSVETHVLVDLMGSVRGSEGVALRPNRLLDTRSGVGAPAGALSAPLSTAAVHVAGRAGVPAGSGLAIVNVTSTGATADGFVTAYPCDQPVPNTSTLNLSRGRDVANLAFVPIANDGTICVRATLYGGGAVHLIADVMGWLPGAALPATVPTRFATLPLGVPLPSSADCATRVKRVPENKRMNVAKNAVRGTNHNLGGASPLARVDGDFSGTTDELLQWTACKWGIDEDIVRGMIAKESWWRDTQLGDFTTNSAVCAYGHTIGSDGVAGQCPQSTGLGQINWQFYKDAYPTAAQSNAYHLDYGFAVWRSCYEGAFTWLNNVDKGAVYGPGDAWGCVGFWNAGRWHTAKGEGYVAEVKDYITQRIWEQPNFQEP